MPLSPLQQQLEQELAYWDNVLRTKPDTATVFVRRGMTLFKLARIPEAIADFDHAEQLDSNLTPYLWQRGLAYYYADRFEEGARQFEVDLQVNGRDVEETVWRYLCLAQLHGAASAQQTLLEVKNDPRAVMRQVYELFAGRCSPTVVLEVGDRQGTHGRFYSHLYVGLWQEAAGETEQAKHYIGQAAQRYKVEDYMWNLAVVHQSVRGWKDD
jgi:tetratricopeptide (TPR) repeat protein